MQEFQNSDDMALTKPPTTTATDSVTVSGEHFFEGVEKLLEIWFEPVENADLRKVSRPLWDNLLKTVRCEIISCTRNDDIDAYVLSESSMFVSKRRWILKTCGTTVPLQCLRDLFTMATQIAGYDAIQELFYSRKNFKRPEQQPTPHRSFDTEIALLDEFFENGHAYCLGSMNRDCWYIYTASRLNSGSTPATGSCTANNMVSTMANDAIFKRTAASVSPQNVHDSVLCNNSNSSTTSDALFNSDDENAVDDDKDDDNDDDDGELSCNSNDSGCGGFAGGQQPQPEPDQTIEILMTELDPKVMALFTKSECVDATMATQRAGIHKLLPGMRVDDYLFEPCGYSMNGIGQNNGCYMTIHITPEPQFSYVSFESNVAASNYGELITRVIETFQPNKFVVTIFANKTSIAYASARELDHVETMGLWQRKDIKFCRFTSYDLTYAHYCKFPS